jgi:hypothetical protein
MEKQLPTTNVEIGKSSRASKGLPCKPCGRSVNRSSVPTSVKLFGVVNTCLPSSYRFHERIISLVNLRSEIGFDSPIRRIGKKKILRPPHAVVETRSLIFQLKLRKPSGRHRSASRSQNFPSEGDHTDSQPYLCQLLSLVRDLLSTSVSSAIQLSTTSALMVAVMLFNQRLPNAIISSRTTKFTFHAQQLDHCLRMCTATP